jgi:hypothetical protein
MPILPKNETNCSKSKFPKILEPDSCHIYCNCSFDKKADFSLRLSKKIVKSGYSSLISIPVTLIHDGESGVGSRESGNVELLTLTRSCPCNRKRYDLLTAFF